MSGLAVTLPGGVAASIIMAEAFMMTFCAGLLVGAAKSLRATWARPPFRHLDLGLMVPPRIATARYLSQSNFFLGKSVNKYVLLWQTLPHWVPGALARWGVQAGVALLTPRAGQPLARFTQT